MTSSEAPVLVTAQTVLVIDDDYALGAALASLVCRLCVPLCLCGKRSSPHRHRDVRREAEIRGATAVLNKPVTVQDLKRYLGHSTGSVGTITYVPTIDDVLGDGMLATVFQPIVWNDNAFARELGIRFCQGFYYSRPTTIDMLMSRYA
jgi:hypothetical protein